MARQLARRVSPVACRHTCLPFLFFVMGGSTSDSSLTGTYSSGVTLLVDCRGSVDSILD